jgi:hypothetical protein
MAHSTPTNQKPSIALILVHSSAGVWRPKEKPPGGGWGILNKRQAGRSRRWWEVSVERQRGRRQEAEAVQQEVMLQSARANKRVAQQDATWQPDGALKSGGASRGCGAMRSPTTTNQANGR